MEILISFLLILIVYSLGVLAMRNTHLTELKLRLKGPQGCSARTRFYSNCHLNPDWVYTF